jgi:hypothetical protein
MRNASVVPPEMMIQTGHNQHRKFTSHAAHIFYKHAGNNYLWRHTLYLSGGRYAPHNKEYIKETGHDIGGSGQALALEQDGTLKRL